MLLQWRDVVERGELSLQLSHLLGPLLWWAEEQPGQMLSPPRHIADVTDTL